MFLGMGLEYFTLYTAPVKWAQTLPPCIELQGRKKNIDRIWNQRKRGVQHAPQIYIDTVIMAELSKQLTKMLHMSMSYRVRYIMWTASLSKLYTRTKVETCSTQNRERLLFVKAAFGKLHIFSSPTPQCVLIIVSHLTLVSTFQFKVVLSNNLCSMFLWRIRYEVIRKRTGATPLNRRIITLKW